MRPSGLILAPSVETALRERVPVVALESTLIAHGLPFPESLDTALAMEQNIRAEGAVPATIGIIKGQLRVGLSSSDLELLATNPSVRKISRRDLAIAVAAQMHGATTVAATMYVAFLAGIRVFATGGIGGVHRGNPFDISADLPELATTPMAVVSSGAKAILDLPATREWLETHGVPVLGYGTDEFPAFFSRGSGLPVDQRVDAPGETAQIIKAHWDLGLRSGVLVGVPVPEAEAVDPQTVEQAIAKAMAEAEKKGLTGKGLTPFLLDHISESTGQKSLRANIALLKNNAAVAARIATALAALQA